MSDSSRVVRMGISPTVHLHARVFHCDEGPPGNPWYVDIDDLTDQQPDDPFWYGYFDSQAAALDAACHRIATMAHDPLLADHLTRVSQHPLPQATFAA